MQSWLESDLEQVCFYELFWFISDFFEFQTSWPILHHAGWQPAQTQGNVGPRAPGMLYDLIYFFNLHTFAVIDFLGLLVKYKTLCTDAPKKCDNRL